MKVYVAGNPFVRNDSLPIRIVPHLQKVFPHVVFEEVDSNENFIPEDGSVIIDTVSGIRHVTWFDNIDAFVATKSVSPHDFDLGFQLQFLSKLHKLLRIKILGIPMDASEKRILADATRMLHDVIISRSRRLSPEERQRK